MDTLEQFELFLVQGGRRRSSITIYKTIFKRVEREVGIDFRREKIDAYLLSLQQMGRKPRSLNMVVNVVRLYGQCFKRPDLLDYPFFKRPRYSERVTMTDEEIEAFLALPMKSKSMVGSHASYMRNYRKRYGEDYKKYTLFFSILAFTGMRPVELAQMTLERIDFTQRIFKLREEDVKTHEPRIVPIPDRVYSSLYSYTKNLTGKYLFPSKKGGLDMMGLPCLNATDWGYNFHQRIQRLGIKRAGLSVYSLRHSLITRLLDEDINLYKVQNLVGHKNVSTTVMYYHSSTKALKDTVSKDPMGRKSTPPEKVLDQLIEHIQSFLQGDERFKVSIDRNTEGHVLLDVKWS